MDNVCMFFWSKRLEDSVREARWYKYSDEVAADSVQKEVASRSNCAMDKDCISNEESPFHVARVL